jgi:lantibiotic biosynthesis protein
MMAVAAVRLVRIAGMSVGSLAERIELADPGSDCAIFPDGVLVADAIGRSLVDTALWSGDRCTWLVQPNRSRDGRPSAPQPAGGTLYRGSAGIALFLLELYRATGDQRYASTGSGALRHAIADMEALPRTASSLYSGRAGAAWVAALSRDVLQSGEHSARVCGLIRPVLRPPGPRANFDLIAGTAGSIMAFLCMAEILADDSFVADARNLGLALIDSAVRTPDGWWWGTPRLYHHRPLTGLAHGAACAAWALAELCAATGEGRFRYAADAAVAYERSRFDRHERNWPDYRMSHLSELAEDPAALQAAVEANPAVLRYHPRFMNAWCHGAPGIALSRFRMHALLRDETLLREAVIGTETTAASLRVNPSTLEFSLCHGIAGKCETLVAAAACAELPAAFRHDLRSLVEECAEVGRLNHASGNAPWPCGTWMRRLDPGLMLGTAGIGLFYLRISGLEVASAVLPHPTTTEAAPRGSDNSFVGIRDESIQLYFGATLGALTDHNGGSPALAPMESGLHEVHDRLAEVVSEACCSEAARSLFRLESSAYQLAQGPPGWEERLLGGVTGLPDPLPPDWRVGLPTNGVRVLIDGDSVSPSAALISVEPPGFKIQKISGLATFVLAEARRPVAIADVIERAVRSGLPRIQAEQLVAAQVRAAMLAGFLVRRHAPAEAGSNGSTSTLQTGG